MSQPFVGCPPIRRENLCMVAKGSRNDRGLDVSEACVPKDAHLRQQFLYWLSSRDRLGCRNGQAVIALIAPRSHGKIAKPCRFLGNNTTTYMPQREFQTEVSQLLQLIVHSLYSHPEIFLRELISNSSDALDKLRYLTLTDDAYKALPFDPRIDLELDEENNTLTISDTGIGMNEEDLAPRTSAPSPDPERKTSSSQLSGRREERFEPHRPVRGRLLQLLHGRGPCRSRIPQSGRNGSLALDQRRQDRL